jgi:4-amino-4-deoxy-L-arabinose transferase-like glycosyltransferase
MQGRAAAAGATEVARLERWGWAAIAAGIALRLAAPFFMDLGYDANAYAAMGHAWSKGHSFLMPYGDVLTFAPAPPGYSHYFPPAYPFYLGVVFSLFGFGLAQAKLAAVAMGLAALAVVHWTTRDLYGRTVALAVTGLMAVEPHLVWITGMGMSENLALVFFALTLWAVIRSLKQEWYLVWAGLFAGLAFLTRSSMGPFFAFAVAGGFLWRFSHRRWRVFTSLPDMGAVATFAVIYVLWGWRNVSLFGWPNWETAATTHAFVQEIGRRFPAYLQDVGLRIPYMLVVPAPMLILLWPQARSSLRRVREEHTGFLWLAAFLIWLLAVLFSAAWLLGSGGREIVSLDNWRYVVVALLPLGWALVREAKPDARAFQRRWAALVLVSILGCAGVFAFPAHYLPAEGARALDPLLQPGDSVAVYGQGKYAFYAYVPHPDALRVFSLQLATTRPDFVIATAPLELNGYTVLGEKREHHPLGIQRDDDVRVLARSDVVAARNATAGSLHPGW